MERRVVLVLLLLCVCASPPPAGCFSSCKVTASCEDLRPRHAGLSPQTEPAPFAVTTQVRSFAPGQELTVHLQAADSRAFTGFLLQARALGGASAVGSFSLTAGGAQLLSCSRRASSAVSHSSESPKTSVQVKWRLESSAASIQFHATFVESYRIFWVDVTSSPLLSEQTLTRLPSPPSSPAPAPAPAPVPAPAPAPTAAPTAVLATTKQQVSAAAAPQPEAELSAAGCGATKLCFSRPPGCQPLAAAHCYFMSAAAVPPDAFRFEMSGPSDGYVSFGLSDDRRMGNDDIYICRVSAQGLVELQHAFSTGPTPPQHLPLGNVSGVRAWLQDAVISCSFTSHNPILTERSAGASTASAYHLMFAHGSVGSDGGIQLHRSAFVSWSKALLSQPQRVVVAPQPAAIRAHGALMLVAWMSVGSWGMLAARYLRAAAAGRKLMGKEAWFVVHVAAMSVTMLATVIAFILSFSHVKSWSGGAHPVVGCLVMILCVLQWGGALLRCGPQHPLRFVFRWTHALSAVAIKALAVAAILTGLMLLEGADGWPVKVMGGLVGWEAAFFILLEVRRRFQMAEKDGVQATKRAADVLLMALFLLGNLAFVVALLVGIGTS